MDRSKKAFLKEYLTITVGMCFAAAGIYFFMMPSDIILGSITGLAMILVHVIPLPVSLMTFLLNLLCLLIGFLLIGREFGAKTVYSSVLLPIFLYLLEQLFPGTSSPTGDIILDTISCILLISIGQALMFHVNASSGGLDILAKVVNKYLHVEIGKAVAGIGILTVLLSIFVYPVKMLIVGILGTYLNGMVVDNYIGGFSRKKRVCILTDRQDELIDYIMHTLNRGITLYDAQGAYDRKTKKEIITILANNEYAKLMEYLRLNAPDAFVTVSTVNETAGKWNKPSRKR